jgi:hypothetical protein
VAIHPALLGSLACELTWTNNYNIVPRVKKVVLSCLEFRPSVSCLRTEVAKEANASLRAQENDRFSPMIKDKLQIMPHKSWE